MMSNGLIHYEPFHPSFKMLNYSRPRSLVLNSLVVQQIGVVCIIAHLFKCLYFNNDVHVNELNLLLIFTYQIS
jgi:hypothetical protein